MLENTQKLIKEVTKNLDKLKFKFAGDEVYHFIWDRLANDYLEKIKDNKDPQSLYTLKYSFLSAIKLLHPFMPYVTEAVWQELKAPEDSPLIISVWPI